VFVFPPFKLYVPSNEKEKIHFIHASFFFFLFSTLEFSPLSFCRKGAMSIVKRYNMFPRTLYRVQSKMNVYLRNHETQMSLGRTSYDLKTVDGLVMPAVGDKYIGPNGISLRPPTEKMMRILKEFSGEPIVFAMLEGLPVPPGLVLLHEHSDHYSLQTSEPITLEALNTKMTDFFKTLPRQTRDQFFAQMADEDDQDN
jgi:hypothetical protein